jgi:hypothetical protein
VLHKEVEIRPPTAAFSVERLLTTYATSIIANLRHFVLATYA